MSTATLTHAENNNRNGARHFFAGFSKAAGAFATALWAAQGRQFEARPVAATPVSPRTLQKNRMQLFALANEYQQFSPNLAGELRNLAGRDA